MKTHPLNLSSLLFGLVFLGLAAGWALYELDVVAAPDLMWLLPLLFIAAGVVGIALTATRSWRNRPEENEEEPHHD